MVKDEHVCGVSLSQLPHLTCLYVNLSQFDRTQYMLPVHCSNPSFRCPFIRRRNTFTNFYKIHTSVPRVKRADSGVCRHPNPRCDARFRHRSAEHRHRSAIRFRHRSVQSPNPRVRVLNLFDIMTKVYIGTSSLRGVKLRLYMSGHNLSFSASNTP